jgi:hypothetical protein
LTLNRLRSSRVNPRLSAYAYLNGNFDFNKTPPLAPPGTKVLIHLKPDQQASWAYYGEEGWYVGPLMEHYRCVKCYIPKSGRELDIDTLTFFPKSVPFPQISTEDYLKQAASDIVAILQQPPTNLPFLAYGDTTNNALVQIATLLGQASDQPTSPIVQPLPTRKGHTLRGCRFHQGRQSLYIFRECRSQVTLQRCSHHRLYLRRCSLNVSHLRGCTTRNIRCHSGSRDARRPIPPTHVGNPSNICKPSLPFTSMPTIYAMTKAKRRLWIHFLPGQTVQHGPMHCATYMDASPKAMVLAPLSERILLILSSAPMYLPIRKSPTDILYGTIAPSKVKSIECAYPLAVTNSLMMPMQPLLQPLSWRPNLS